MDNRNKGKFGEMMVVAKLLELGFYPSLPTIDIGFDIILENGKTIQVKTTSKSFKRSGNGKDYPVYAFNTTSGGRIGGLSKVKYRRKKIADNISDFLVCYAIEDNRFYIIPIKEVGTTWNLVISVAENTKYAKYLDAWNLLEDK